MELKEAIEILKGLIEPQSTLLGSFDKEAINTVLAELDKQTESYERGYRQGYNEGYMAGSMELI